MLVAGAHSRLWSSLLILSLAVLWSTFRGICGTRHPLIILLETLVLYYGSVQIFNAVVLLRMSALPT